MIHEYESHVSDLIDYFNEVKLPEELDEEIRDIVSSGSKMRPPEKVKVFARFMSRPELLEILPEEQKVTAQWIAENSVHYGEWTRSFCAPPPDIMTALLTTLLVINAFDIIHPGSFAAEKTVPKEKVVELIDYFQGLPDRTVGGAMDATRGAIYTFLNYMSHHRDCNMYPWFTSDVARQLNDLMGSGADLQMKDVSMDEKLQEVNHLLNHKDDDVISSILESITKNVSSATNATIEDLGPNKKALVIKGSDIPDEIRESLERLFGDNDGDSSSSE
jgi:hypothetical protein